MQKDFALGSKSGRFRNKEVKGSTVTFRNLDEVVTYGQADTESSRAGSRQGLDRE